MGLKGTIASMAAELIGLRRDFHRHPELGFAEHRSGRIIAEYLADLGLEVARVAGTGVVGLLRGRGGGGGQGARTLALRADMDALPLQEATGLPHASVHDGVMHACGHDGHMAVLLVAAKVLVGLRDEWCGSVKFVFQPNEEGAGAQAMIQAGVLDDPPVDAALALHLWAPLPVGLIGVAAGPVMASSDYFRVTVRGRGGHGGAPHEAVDPVLCGAAIIQEVQAVQTRELSVLWPTLVTFCRVAAGTSPIIVPGEMVLEGSLRCLHEDAGVAKAGVERMIAGICRAHRTEYRLEWVHGNSLMVNDGELVELVRAAAGEALGLGAGASTEEGVRMMIGEDFAEFARRVPAALYLVGAGSSAKGTAYPHHHPRFDIDEDALAYGVEMHVRTALRFLAES